MQFWSETPRRFLALLRADREERQKEMNFYAGVSTEPEAPQVANDSAVDMFVGRR
jgi:hypothetical protein